MAIELTEQEQKLIEQLRLLDWGWVEVVVQDKKLVMVSIKKSIKLDNLGNLC